MSVLTTPPDPGRGLLAALADRLFRHIQEEVES
jgi:hypothetical protein